MKKTLLLVLLSSLLSVSNSWASAPAKEIRKIEMLIDTVKELKEAEFIRNGRSYNSKIAVMFLNGKWKAKKKEISTADDFITKIATKSSTSGKPYFIRFSDGKEQKSELFFKGLLNEMDPEE
ncbi:MAG: DUF5329 family protein [Chitinispirillaceae bacterium]